MRRRAILLFTATVAALLLASGTALGALKIGTDGPDTLIGTSSVDQVSGGKGDDTLKGLAGNDIYYFADGWGSDTLEEPRKIGKKSGGSDTLSFSQTTTNVDVSLIRQWGPDYNLARDSNFDNFVELGNSVVENVVGGIGNDGIASGGESNMLQPGGNGGYDILRDYGGFNDGSGGRSELPASNDVFKGFETNSGSEYIADFGGTADVLDMRPFSSSEVYVDAIDFDFRNGTKESLQIVYRNSTGVNVQVLVEGHFGAFSYFTSDWGQQGRIEQLVFSDGTFSGEGGVGSNTASTSAASSEEASANNTVEGLISASKERAKTTREGAELEKAAEKLSKEVQKEAPDDALAQPPEREEER